MWLAVGALLAKTESTGFLLQLKLLSLDAHKPACGQKHNNSYDVASITCVRSMHKRERSLAPKMRKPVL
jgi:hypothetical protein